MIQISLICSFFYFELEVFCLYHQTKETLTLNDEQNELPNDLALLTRISNTGILK
jgi:hypothetical protein